MESLGEKLRSSRREQDYTIDQVARDTMISRRYLEALEAEDFSAFPGEAYLIGFLRNYAEYLGLDISALITLYRNMKLQEQPIPMEELIHGKKRVSPILIGAGALAAAAVLAVAVYFITRSIGGRESTLPAEAAAPVSQEPTEYVFDVETDTRWFEENDRIDVSLGERQYRLRIAAIDRNLTLDVPGGTVQLELSESRFLDLNLDNKNDVKIYFNDIDSIGEVRRVNLQLTKASLLLAEDADQADSTRPEPAGAESSPGADTGVAEEGGAGEGESAGSEQAAAGEPASESEAGVAEAEAGEAAPVLQAGGPGERVVILEAESPRIFEVEIAFRESCLLRYLLDGELRDQRYFQKSEEFLLDNVRREVQLWISNAGALTLKIEGREVKFGRVGQVVTKLIRWQKAEGEEMYRLEVVSAY